MIHSAGSDGNDELRGGEGDDVLSGGDGADILNGHEGEDLIVGAGGRDTADGGADNDRIFGGEGPDILAGGDGDDEIHGNEGVDVINGGEGNDSLFGGIDNNVFEGDGGRDLILSGGKADSIVDGGDDVIIEFGSDDVTPGSEWTDNHIQTVAGALNRIVARANNIDIVGDNNGDNRVQYIKGTDLDAENRRDEEGVLIVQLPDWDAGSALEQREVTSEVIRQLGLIWADASVIDAVFAGSGTFITQFNEVSDWTEGTDVPDGYVASTDGEWFYLEDAEFFSDGGRANPQADWADMWDFVFSDIKSAVDIERLEDKTAVVDAFFDSLSS